MGQVLPHRFTGAYSQLGPADRNMTGGVTGSELGKGLSDQQSMGWEVLLVTAASPLLHTWSRWKGGYSGFKGGECSLLFGSLLQDFRL